MGKQKILIGASVAIGALFFSACRPQAGLPAGPTPIPTLAPVEAFEAEPLPSETPVGAILSYPARPPSAQQGQDLYFNYCLECHGPDGTGAMPKARNFLDLDYMRGEAPATFYAAVTEGRGEMPAYQDILNSDERWDAVYYIWRLSTSEQTLEQGSQIYEQNCASCHGENGSGELLGAADFTNLREMANLAPRDLYLTVTQGRGSMPGWQPLLSQDQRWAVIDYVSSFSYDPALEAEGATTPDAAPPSQPPTCDAQQENPFAWDDADAVAAGGAIFEAQCTICHGQDGRGGLPGTVDFTSQNVSAELQETAGEKFCLITGGMGAMPSFRQTLTAEERWQALTFLASLGK